MQVQKGMYLTIGDPKRADDDRPQPHWEEE